MTQTQSLSQAIFRAKSKSEIQPLINQFFANERKKPQQERQVPRPPMWYEMLYDNEGEFDAYLDKYFKLLVSDILISEIYLLVEG